MSFCKRFLTVLRTVEYDRGNYVPDWVRDAGSRVGTYSAGLHSFGVRESCRCLVLPPVTKVVPDDGSNCTRVGHSSHTERSSEDQDRTNVALKSKVSMYHISQEFTDYSPSVSREDSRRQ